MKRGEIFKVKKSRKLSSKIFTKISTNMKKTILLLSLVFVVFLCCEKKIDDKSANESIKKPDSILANKTEIPDTKNDSLELQKLVQDLYQWNETKNSNPDFDVVQKEKTDTVYANLDLKKHNERLQELKETNFFAKEFFDNYNKIALTIDEKMRNKSVIYNIGYLPPFGNGANPWCNCQDHPDNYWKTLTIKKLSIEGSNANFVWTWGEGFEYKTKATKENNIWKISYLEGFDFDEFFQ